MLAAQICPLCDSLMWSGPLMGESILIICLGDHRERNKERYVENYDHQRVVENKKT